MDEQRKKDLPIDRGWAWVITFGKIKMLVLEVNFNFTP